MIEIADINQENNNFSGSAVEATDCGAALCALVRKAIPKENFDDICSLSKCFSEQTCQGRFCSAFSVSLLVIGLLYGRTFPNANYQGDREIAKQLYEIYQMRFGTTDCSKGSSKSARCCKERAEALLDVLQDVKESGMKEWDENQERLMDKFGVHESVKPYAALLLEDLDWELVARAKEDRDVDLSDLDAETIKKEYQRGIINKISDAVETGYKLAFFSRRIDCCLRGEYEFWKTLPQDAKKSFVGYMQSFDVWVFPELEAKTWEKAKIMPVEEVIRRIKETKNQIYVQVCDCRTHAGHPCGNPTDTCMHWPDSTINTSLDRGFAKALTKDEAIANITRSDECGLVHTWNEGGNVCNCCQDCCWTFSHLDRFEGTTYDPKKDFYEITNVISVAADKCVGCGKCVKQCPFGALTIENGVSRVDEEKCYGCGVCRCKCKHGALTLVDLVA